MAVTGVKVQPTAISRARQTTGLCGKVARKKPLLKIKYIKASKLFLSGEWASC